MTKPQELISGYIFGKLTESQAAELNNWIKADPHNARVFAREIFIHRSLYDIFLGTKIKKRLLEGLPSSVLDDSAVFREVLKQDLDDSALQEALREGQDRDAAGEQTPTLRRKPSRTDVFHALSNIAAVILISLVVILIDRAVFRKAPPAPTVAVLSDGLGVQWADPLVPISPGSPLRAGGFKLKEGYAQITFSDGAVIVLQAPCDFRLESSGQMYLRSGVLSATVPKEAVGFVVRTDAASIVDYGTEFGVIAHASGQIETHVFKGEVDFRTGSSPLLFDRALRLTEGQAGRVDREGDISMTPVATQTHRFLRTLPTAIGAGRPGHAVDLADIVGGGNGLGTGRLGCGIDPLTGEFIKESSHFSREGSSQVIPVEWTPYIAGVFVPYRFDQGATPLVPDGTLRYQFPDSGGVWYTEVSHGGPINLHKPEGDTAFFNGRIHGAAQSGSMISLHSNLGITFDLRAIRESIPGVRITRFTSQCGVCDNAGEEPYREAIDATFYVLVDGRLCYHSELSRSHYWRGAIQVDLRDTDRYLTLVCTEGRLNQGDWSIFAGPMLQLEALPDL